MLFTLLLAVPLSQVYCQTTQAGLLDWLQGIWLDDDTGMYEEWKKTGTDEMQAEGYRWEKGTKDIHGKITLQYTPEGATYMVNSIEADKSSRSGAYQSVEFTRESAVFKRISHEFPAKIKYERQGTDALRVLLYDRNDNLKVTHNFKRIQR